MLYHLFEYFNNSNIDFAGMGLMKYISFRAVMASVIAIITSLLVGKKIIKMLQKKQIGEEIRDLGLEGQLQKKGTPTMGGIIIIIAILVPALLFGDLTNIYVQLLIISTLWLGALGFLDDYIKVFKKNKEGLSGKYKILAQVVLGLIVGLSICLCDDAKIYPNETTRDSVQQSQIVENQGDTEEIAIASKVGSENSTSNTKTTIPFVKSNEFDYKWLSPFKGRFGEIFTWFIYVLMVIFIITACSNGANLTDGMDGLAAGVSAIIGTAIGILAYVSGHFGYSDYLNIMFIPNSAEVVIFMAAFLGALLGFLWYNSYPAQVFMGDTGSLALGGIIGVAAVIIRKELLLPILCGIFFVESLSVIIQRFYFKYTKKRYGVGKRVFRMTPLHHHYQKANPDAIIQSPHTILTEPKIVVRFMIVSMILAVLSIVTLKIR